MSAYTADLKLGNHIGGGQFGDVFEGQCQVHGQVAVKVLKQKTGETASEWAQRSGELLHEAKTLKTAKHPNIVEVLQVVREATNGVVHLVTEFCDGGSLEKIYKQGPLEVPKIRKIVTEVSRGLQCIHSHGMVHRDIKPANILCHKKAYKIGDFGLVSDRLVLGYASADGYVSHLAPEVFGSGGGNGVTSAKSDVWALGMTVYRLLHGHDFYADAFKFKSATELRNMITNGGFSHKLPWLPHVPDDWRKFVRKAMHDDTTQRFGSAHDMSQALAKLSVDPAWKCVYRFDDIVWTRPVGEREVIVQWKIHSPRKHEWSARRTGAGQRTMCIGGKPGRIVSQSVVRSELEEFFAYSD